MKQKTREIFYYSHDFTKVTVVQELEVSVFHDQRKGFCKTGT